MMINKLKYIILAGFILLVYTQAFSQGHYGGHFNPDSLTAVTVSGTAMVDSTLMPHPVYFLDENGDGTEDFILNFGPFWYEPDSSNATRPDNVESISISGGMTDTLFAGIPMIMVYEINGEFWRDPFSPLWTMMGRHSYGGMMHHGGFHGFTFGWMHDTLQVDTFMGTALLDTTFVMEHFFLDENGDSLPEYQLNFGPPWYDPPSGASRPANGDNVTIVGGVMNRTVLSMVVVFAINGQVWRDTTGFGNNLGANWIYRNMQTPRMAHAPFDTSDWMIMNPGWYQGGHHGGMMPDSMFAQMLQLFPENMPQTGSQNVFAGYEIGMFLPNGQNGMWGGGFGGHMMFGSNSQFQLHYNDIQLQGFNIDENSIEVKYWDNHSSAWVTVANAVYDPVQNTVSFADQNVSRYVILTGNSVTAVKDEEKLVADGFKLRQNYPNPFNPVTNIEFELAARSPVKLAVFNVLGQKVATLVDRRMNAGMHQVRFDAGNLPSGVYFYRLKAGNKVQIKRMTLMK